MAFDPSLPAPNAPVSSAELRAQFNGLQQNIQARALEDECVGRLAQTANNPLVVDGLGMVVSEPPTRQEVQLLADKLDELLAVLKRG